MLCYSSEDTLGNSGCLSDRLVFWLLASWRSWFECERGAVGLVAGAAAGSERCLLQGSHTNGEEVSKGSQVFFLIAPERGTGKCLLSFFHCPFHTVEIGQIGSV